MECKKIPVTRLSGGLVLLLLLSSQCLRQVHAFEIESSAETSYGARVDGDGWGHFVVYSPAATAVDLLLYDNPQDTSPNHVVPMQRQGSDWRIKVKGEGVRGEF